MKKLNVLLLAVALTASSVLSASTTPVNADRPSNEISQQIGDMLQKPSFEVDSEVVANVTFTVNEKQEIVVLTVDTENSQTELYIKSRLNYKKIKNARQGNAYKIPIRIVSEV